jgi:hypothetical protein
LLKLSHWIEGVDDINLISSRYQLGSPERETETEKERETEKTKTIDFRKSISIKPEEIKFDGLDGMIPKPKKKFQKPTPDEVYQYAKSIGFDLSGQKFCDYYESKGWLVGKSPMKDWKACIRTWKSNGYGTAQNGNTGGFQNGTKRDDGFATAKPGKYPD